MTKRSNNILMCKIGKSVLEFWRKISLMAPQRRVIMLLKTTKEALVGEHNEGEGDND